MKDGRLSFLILLLFFGISGVFLSAEEPPGILESGKEGNAFLLLLRERLKEDPGYRQAVLDRRGAELSLRQLKKVGIPYISLTGSRDGLSLVNGEIQPLTLNPEIIWTHVLGTEIGFQAPVTIGGDAVMEAVSFTVTRPLLSSDDVNELKARALLLRTQEKEINARAAVRLQLMKDILLGYVEQQRLEINRCSMEVLEKELEAAVDRDTLRSLQRDIIRAKRAILQAEQTLSDLDPRITADAGTLFRQAQEAAKDWLEGFPQPMNLPDSSLAEEAQEHTLAAAELEKRRWIFDYLPNPWIGFALDYTFPDGRLDWSLSLQFSFTLLDRGERALAVFRRDEQPELERLRLIQTRKNLERDFRQALMGYELLEFDLQLQEFAVEEAVEEEEYAERLYRAGFTSREAFTLAQMDREAEELTMTELRYTMLLRKLELLAFYDKTGKTDE
ncbi:MAG: TolC family protein [Spirochaetales bacterium]|nr:TolC family protein [Spirochaetales bacterium]